MADSERKKQTAKVWREKNKEHRAAYQKEWQEKNKEWKKEYNKKWKEANPDYHIKRYVNKREKCLAYQKAWQRKNPAKQAAYSLRSYRKKMYGITQAQYDEMLASQNNMCAICGRHESKARYGKLGVDHDHKTNAVRKLLCSHCNSMLGHALDSIEILQKGIDYLKAHGIK